MVFPLSSGSSSSEIIIVWVTAKNIKVLRIFLCSGWLTSLIALKRVSSLKLTFVTSGNPDIS